MSDSIKTLFKNWQKGLGELNQFVAEESKSKSKAAIFETLDGSFAYALANKKKSTESGLVEMYKILAKLKK